MSEERLPPELNWPKWQWWGGWASFFQIVLAVIVLVWPDLGQQGTESIVLRILLALFGSAFVVPLTVWLFRASRVIIERVRWFPRSRSLLLFYQQQSATLIRNTLAERAYEIVRARAINSQLTIILRKRRGARLQTGDEVHVIDSQDMLPMGRFRITEIRSDGYYAVSIGEVDAIFLGYVKQVGEAVVLPNLKAYSMSSGENDE